MPPIVAVNERIIGLDVPTVTVDGYQAAKEVIRYLMGLLMVIMLPKKSSVI